MNIIADTGKCVGAGQCVLTEPALFDQSEKRPAKQCTSAPARPSRCRSDPGP